MARVAGYVLLLLLLPTSASAAKHLVKETELRRDGPREREEQQWDGKEAHVEEWY